MEDVGVKLTEATDMLNFGVKELHTGQEARDKLAGLYGQFIEAISAVGAVAAQIRTQTEVVDNNAIQAGQWIFAAAEILDSLTTDKDSAIEASRRTRLAGDMCCNDLGSIVGKNAVQLESVDEVSARLASLRQYASVAYSMASDTGHVENITVHADAAKKNMQDYAASTGIIVNIG